MKKKMILAAMAAVVCVICTPVFAQVKIGTMDGTPIWSIPDPGKIDLMSHKIDSLLTRLSAKDMKNIPPGVYYTPKDKGFRYKSAALDLTYDDGEYRIYLEKEQILCTVIFSRNSQNYVTISVPGQSVEYRGESKSNPFFVSEKTPDRSFFDKGINALESTLAKELTNN